MDIIGGEFKIAPDALQSKNNLKCDFSFGRTCFFSILEAIQEKLKIVLMPDYMYSSLYDVAIRFGILIKQCHISLYLAPFYPEIETIRKNMINSVENAAILLVSYFGLVDLGDIIATIRKGFLS